MALNKEMCILVVDDFQSMRSLIKNLLVKRGFNNIVEADNGEDAWEILEAQTIELVISDWNMPKLKGIDLLRKVRASDKLKDTPFLMVTAEGYKENVLEAIKTGVSGYIVKPFSPAALEEKLAKIFVKQQKK